MHSWLLVVSLYVIYVMLVVCFSVLPPVVIRWTAVFCSGSGGAVIFWQFFDSEPRSACQRVSYTLRSILYSLLFQHCSRLQNDCPFSGSRSNKPSAEAVRRPGIKSSWPIYRSDHMEQKRVQFRNIYLSFVAYQSCKLCTCLIIITSCVCVCVCGGGGGGNINNVL